MKNSCFPMDGMDRIALDFPGRIGFYVEDLITGATHQHGADRRFPTASICKLPIMIELFRQAEGGKLALDERRRIKGDFSRSMGALRRLEDEPELVICTSHNEARMASTVKAKRLEFGHGLRYRIVDPESEEGGNPSPRKGPTVLWLKKRDRSGGSPDRIKGDT